MSRPLRIEYPDAWYHVMNRGRRAENIFIDKDDYKAFIQVLIESTEMWSLRISAYCLMGNHYHLLVQTPQANLSRCMRHINGVYTQRFNRRHCYDGQLFRGRYKSILVSDDPYLLQVVRYIHKNPVKAGIVSQPEKYLWSSHNSYLSVNREWDWLNKSFIYSLLTKDRKQWISRYRQYMTAGDDDELTTIMEGRKWPTVVGSKAFVDWVKGHFYAMKDNEDMPEAKMFAPSADLILQTVCSIYNISPDKLYQSQRGVFNEPRSAAIYLMRKLRHDTLKEIGMRFKIKKYSSVSSIIERMKQKMANEPGLKERIVALSGRILKSQRQI